MSTKKSRFKLFEYKPSTWDIAFAKKNDWFNLGIPALTSAVGVGAGQLVRKLAKTKSREPLVSGFLAGLGLGDVLTDILAERHSSLVRPKELTKVRRAMGQTNKFRHFALYEQGSGIAEGLIPFAWLTAEAMETPFTAKLAKALAATEAGLMITRIGARTLLMNPMIRRALKNKNNVKLNINNPVRRKNIYAKTNQIRTAANWRRSKPNTSWRAPKLAH